LNTNVILKNKFHINEGLKPATATTRHFGPVAYPGILFRGVSTNSVEDRGQGSGAVAPLVRGSGGSCNFVQEISIHIVKSS